MGAVHFVQYLRPDGRQRMISIERPDEVAIVAQRMAERGCRFEAEVLLTDHVSLEVIAPWIDSEQDLVSLAMEVVPNGPGVPAAVDRLIREAEAALARANAHG